MIPLMASINDSIASIFLVGILAVVIGYLLKRLHQPYQYGFDVFRNEAQIQFLGEIGVILVSSSLVWKFRFLHSSSNGE